ncbi:MAG: ParB/RepB/Spo0J family partition protein [Patescibacteria group bacterium]
MMLQKQSGLGRGLGAIIPQKPAGAAPTAASTGTEVPVTPATQPVAPASTNLPDDIRTFVRDLPIASIERNPHQPRRHFDHSELEELISSIKEHGVMQPIVVTDLGNGRYQLIAGERRLRASTIAGMHTIPAISREATEIQKLELAIIENVQRSDLNAIEEAIAYRRLIDDFGMTQEEVGKKMGKSRPQIANTVRLLQLPQEIQQAIVEKKISQSNARTLLSLPTDAERLKLFKTMVTGHVTVREAEEEVHKTRTPRAFDANAAAAEDTLRKAYGVKVSIKRQATGKGEMKFTFTNDEEFEDLLNKLKPS